MRSLIKNFRRELNDFWKWAGLTIKEYEENRTNHYWEEWDYSNWAELQKLTAKAINHLKNVESSKELVELILEYMAIDNEEENTLGLCEKEFTISFI